MERYVTPPIKNLDLYDMWKKHVRCFWTKDEINITSSDLREWNDLTPDERQFFKCILGFFASTNIIVSDNLALRFLADPNISREARCFYSFQIAMENIHSETYIELLTAYVPEEKERNELLYSIISWPCLNVKSRWAVKWMNDEFATYAERLVAFAVVEGIMFSSSFAGIYWIKQSGLLAGLTQANEFISRDEGLHCTFACTMYGKIKPRLPDTKVRKIVLEGCEVEKLFVKHALRKPLLGMNSHLMETYVNFVTDNLLTDLGYEKEFGVNNPFPFMDNISMQGKTNFFERRVTEYTRLTGHGFTTSVEF
ncbi:ribonucleoside-diphosphate reductase subunit M2-like [Saccoglossus kowalevskii]|uniref:Ribonucleoside-diphosphate reductase subunit M2-like n=1 Tax=Saccoglossus kowalevskii TaxID=10224 RepID=A0ABM0GXM4_SACKO|nr:PREDICTED: ribonucleoside-diphosphate reductase subunit M2-like [Saccoglossus kowalevskii]